MREKQNNQWPTRPCPHITVGVGVSLLICHVIVMLWSVPPLSAFEFLFPCLICFPSNTTFVCALWQTCMGKDVTLHVSASNPAMLLYQKFGFKTEEYILDFYDKYYPLDSKECRHAFFLRLRRWCMELSGGSWETWTLEENLAPNHCS